MTVPTLPQIANGTEPKPRPARPVGLRLGPVDPKPKLRLARPEGGQGGKFSRASTEAIRYLGTVRNFARETLDSYQTSADQFARFLLTHSIPDELLGGHFKTGHTWTAQNRP